MTRPATARRRAALWVAAALALVLLPLVAVGSPPAPRLAPAADGSQFSAGNIISDEIFFDGGSMTAPEVQAFLDLKGASCRTGSDGTPCLRVYRQDTVTKPADGRCATYAGAPMESAADIIAKVGAACGVNPRVLLVMMQKEQSLVTNSGSSLYATRYQKAMGFGCPDTAACDTQYYGFFNQVYNAARQFQNYRQRPTSYGYRAGLTNQIRFSPDASCGSAPVYLANQATAGLYNYTPYQPNAAALRAGYGSGDSCSAYGNRNFWMYYTDWFGSTQSPGGGAIAARYAVLGGSGGQLGAATSLITCGLAGGGCFQQYAGGAIHWSPATGAVETKGWVASEWASQSRENGPLGYPVAPEEPAVGGVLQRFQGGTVWSSPSSGAHAVWGWVLGKYTGLGGESSVLGFPTSDEVAVPGGVSQSFQGGMVFSSAATGAHEVHGWVLDKWTAMGGVSGALGFPTSDEVRTADGVYNTFVGGAVFSTPSTGAHEVHGWIGARWLALGAGSAAVGFPVSDELPVGDGVGVYNQFSNGVVVSSPSTGAHDVRGALAVKWSALGGAGSFLGYPTADQRSAPGGGQVAAFSGGSVYWSSGTGAFEVHGWIRDRWLANGGPGGGLGYPTSDEQPAPGGVGVFQTFANGLVFSSPSTGAREVRGLIEDEYTALGGLASSVGVPVTDELTMPDGFGRASVFSSGAAIYYSPASGAWQVRGWIRGTWSATNAEAGFLGYPLGDEESAGVPGAVLQRFQGGRVYSSGATGAREVHGSILARYLQLGGPASSLGLPVSNEYRSGNVARSDFQRGSITCNLTTGAITVTTS